MTIHQNLIGGQWTGTETRPDINPSNTNDVVGEFSSATRQDAEQAIAAAKAAFPAWSRSGIMERHTLLRKTAQEIRARSDEIGYLLSREEGKTLAEGVGETLRAAQIFDFFAGEALRLNGEAVPSARPGIGVEVTREPVGVVGIITPWNFPVAIPAWKIAPALAAGCTVVHKPAEWSPLTAMLLAEIAHEVGLPAGVLNLVNGVGEVAGRALTEHPGIHAIAFVGGWMAIVPAIYLIWNVVIKFSEKKLSKILNWLRTGLDLNQK